MNEFENIESVWKTQTKKTIFPPDKIIEKAKKIQEKVKSKHRWAQLILFITVIFLSTFFIYVQAYHYNQSSLGALLMVVPLIGRVFIEFLSEMKFRKLDVTEAFQKYAAKTAKFYYWRKKVHFIHTPIILIMYISGFILLLPYFKKSVSIGFYNYIWISGIVFFIIFCFFIYRQIRKELSVLKFLKELAASK